MRPRLNQALSEIARTSALGAERRQRVEARRALLDLTKRHGAGLDLEAGMIEQELPEDATGLRRVAAAEIQVARRAEERRKRAEAERREVDEIEDQTVLLAGVEPGAASDALRVEPLGPRRARHGHAGDAGVVEALGEHRDVGEDLELAGAESGEHVGAHLGSHLAVNEAGANAEELGARGRGSSRARR